MKMDIPETRAMLQQVAHYDHRTITDPMVTDWQHALLRQPIEAVFDAIHDHYERCNSAHTVPLTAGEVLHHTTQARQARDLKERRQRDQQRNEAVFGSLHDQRTATDQDRAKAAARAGRAELDAILTARRTKADTP